MSQTLDISDTGDFVSNGPIYTEAFSKLIDARARAQMRLNVEQAKMVQIAENLVETLQHHWGLRQEDIRLIGSLDSRGDARAARFSKHDHSLKTYLFFGLEGTPIAVPILLTYEHSTNAVVVQMSEATFDLKDGFKSLTSHIEVMVSNAIFKASSLDSLVVV